MMVRARGSQYFGLVCFFCIPMVWHPIFFAFVFGSFGTDVPMLLINMGFLRMLQKNLLPAIAAAAQEAGNALSAPSRAFGPGRLAPARS